MPLMLDNMRAEFARFLADDPQGRFRMDKALAHVIQLSYERGLDDGRRGHHEDELVWRLAHNLLNPDVYGYAVSKEVRNAAREAIGIEARES